MSELESVNIGVDMCDGIKCDTEYTELNETFDLVHDEQLNSQSDVCCDGLCPINWKPLRHTAA